VEKVEMKEEWFLFKISLPQKSGFGFFGLWISFQVKWCKNIGFGLWDSF
jgi:hypothetical protein